MTFNPYLQGKLQLLDAYVPFWFLETKTSPNRAQHPKL